MDEKAAAEIKIKFLTELRETCNVGKAAENAGVDRSTIRRWRNADEKFAGQVDQAKKDAVEALEDEVHRRAFQGTLKIGKQGAYLEYSDTLAIFLLKAHAPEKYREMTRTEITGANGEPLNATNEQIANKLDAIMEAAKARRQAVQASRAAAREPDDDYADLC